MKKIIIITLCWKREKIFEIFAENLKQFISKNKDFDFRVWCAISEFKYIRIIQNHGFNFYTCDNLPLGKKLGQILSIISKLNFDYVLLLNSGNVFSENFFEPYREAINKGIDVVGFKDLYYVDKGKFYYRKGYKKDTICDAYAGSRENEPVGCGRLLSRKFLERCNFKPVWEDNTVYLDGILWSYVLKYANGIEVLNLKEKNILFCGLKNEDNLHGAIQEGGIEEDISYLYDNVSPNIGTMIKNFYK